MENNKQYISDFSKWIMSLKPEEFTILSVLTGYILSQFLNTNEQNAIGNWLENVGQILLTISAQSFLLEPDVTINDINELKKEISELKANLNNLKNL